MHPNHVSSASCLIRADAYPAIGSGDLVSVLRLGERMYRWGCSVYYMTKDTPTARNLLQSVDIKRVYFFPPEFDPIDEKPLLEKICQRHEVQLILWEITACDLSEYYLSSQIKHACIDFSGRIPENVSLVINWDIHALTLYDRLKHCKTRFLLGPEYVIMDEGFDNPPLRRKKSQDWLDVLVFMGGCDRMDYTVKVCQELIESKDLRLSVITGAGYHNCKDLSMLLEIKTGIHKHFSCVPSLLPYCLSCDVAVSSGGLSAFEMMATGIPVCLMALEGHQVNRCGFFAESGGAHYLGFRPDSLSGLSSILRNAYQTCVKTKLVRCGTFRLAEILLKLAGHGGGDEK